MEAWKSAQQKQMFKTRDIYLNLLDQNVQANWKNLFMNNMARPRACFVLWMACHGKLATKDRLYRMGFINDDICVLCAKKKL